MAGDGSGGDGNSGLRPEAVVFVPRRESGAIGVAVVAGWQPPKPRAARDNSAAAKVRKRGRRGTGEVRRQTRRKARAVTLRDNQWARGCTAQQLYCAQKDTKATMARVVELEAEVAGLHSTIENLQAIVSDTMDTQRKVENQFSTVRDAIRAGIRSAGDEFCDNAEDWTGAIFDTGQVQSWAALAAIPPELCREMIAAHSEKHPLTAPLERGRPSWRLTRILNEVARSHAEIKRIGEGFR